MSTLFFYFLCPASDPYWQKITGNQLCMNPEKSCMWTPQAENSEQTREKQVQSERWQVQTEMCVSEKSGPSERLQGPVIRGII